MNNSLEYKKVEDKWFDSKRFKKRRLKYLVNFERGVEPGSKNYGIEGEGKRFIRVNDIGSNNKDNVYVKLETDSICNKEDILLCLDGSPGIVVRGFEGIFSTGLRKLELKDKELDYNYLFYSLNCDFSQECVSFFSKGTTIMHSSDSTNYLKQPLPSKEEQIIISDYLDESTKKLNKVIENKKRQVELIDDLYRLKINSILNENKSPENKLTPNLSWTKKLSKDYSVKKLKKCLAVPLSNGLFKKKEFFGEGTLLVNVFDIYPSIFIDVSKIDRVRATDKEIDNFGVNEKDIFLTRSSLKLEGVATCAIVNKCAEPIVFECHLIKITANSNLIEPSYLAFYLRYFANDMLVSLSNTVTMTTISQPKIDNLNIILPPVDIQKDRIVEIMNIYNSKQELEKGINNQISKLEEYKKILINDVVTGKMKVSA